MFEEELSIHLCRRFAAGGMQILIDLGGIFPSNPTGVSYEDAIKVLCR